MKFLKTIKLKSLKYGLTLILVAILAFVMIPTGQLFAQDPATASLDVAPAPVGQETMFDVSILEGMGGWFQLVVYGAEEYDQWAAGGYIDPEPDIVFNDGIGNQPPDTGIPSDDFSETYSHIFSEGGDYVARVFGSTIVGYPTFSSNDQYFTIESKPAAAPEEPAPWVRDRQMTCYQVWINEDNNFEFVFWWEYKNNNWVKIYDMEENEVFSIDMKYGNARFEAELPDGMYTVKTFHSSDTPIQEFIIGKP